MAVPAYDAQLAAEFHQRGVRPGRLHVVVREEPGAPAMELLAYFGSFDGPTDPAEQSE